MYGYLAKYFVDLLCLRSLPPKTVRGIQIRRLRRLVEFARKRSQFYRDLYSRAGVMDLTIRTMDDVRRLPVVDKQMMLAYGLDGVLTVAKDTPRLKCEYTSGSTGTSFPVYVDRLRDFAAHIRVFVGLWSVGYRPHHRLTTIWRLAPNEQMEIERRTLLGSVQRFLGLFQRDIIPVEDDPEDMIAKLRRRPPDMLFTTVSMLEIIARRLEQRGEVLPIPLLVPGAETMYPHHIERFSRVFRGKVATLYGCRECPTMAVGDPERSLGVMPNSVFFELVNIRPSERGRAGDVLISNLTNYDMPFIRYNLGDVVQVPDGGDAVLSKRIGHIEGRCEDVLQMPSGLQLSHHHGNLVAKEVFDSIRQYKYIRTKDGRVILQFVLLAGADAECVIRRVHAKWRSWLPGEPPEVEFVADLPLAPGGKYKAMEQL